MFKAVSNGIIIALIFVAFIGQTMALNLTTPCESSLDVQHANVSERILSKDAATTDADISAHCCDLDCCDLDCICIANTCSSIVYLPDFVGITSGFILSEFSFITSSEHPHSFVSLLYRPPIVT